jgi:phage-related protein
MYLCGDMKKEWKIKYYRNDEGECPMQDFLNSLKEKDKKKIQSFINYLKQQGIELKRPHSDYLRDGIHELRIQISTGQTRSLYFFCFETNIVFTHGFTKRTKEVPESEINRALIYKEKVLKRYNETNIGEL